MRQALGIAVLLLGTTVAVAQAPGYLPVYGYPPPGPLTPQYMYVMYPVPIARPRPSNWSAARAQYRVTPEPEYTPTVYRNQGGSYASGLVRTNYAPSEPMPVGPAPRVYNPRSTDASQGGFNPQMPGAAPGRYAFGAPPAAQRTDIPQSPSGDYPLTEAPCCPMDGGCSSFPFWVEASYLLWWIKDAPTPIPLVTTSLPTARNPGAVGRPGVRLLFGAEDQDFGNDSGARLMAGWWLDPCHEIGLEGGGFLMQRVSPPGFAVSSGPLGNPGIELPSFDTLTQSEAPFFIAIPGTRAGGVVVDTSNRFWGAEGNLTVNLAKDGNQRTDMLLGFSHFGLEEAINLSSSRLILAPNQINFLGTPVNAGNRLVQADRFGCQNFFYGGQMGLRTTYRRDRWTLGLTGKLALGSMHEVVTNTGFSTRLTPFGPIQAVNSGLFVLPSNRGRGTTDDFAAVPEARIRVGYQLASGITAFAGYNFLYVSSVVRPGDQIDRRVDDREAVTGTTFNPAFRTGPPVFIMNQSDFWAHGLDLGVEWRF